MKKIILIILCMSIMLLTACDLFATKKPIYEVKADKSMVDIFVGENHELSALAYCDGKAVDAPQLTWKSSDESVATVENGRIEAVGVGQAVITVEYNSSKDEIKVNCIGEITADKANNFDERYINIYGRSYKSTDGLKLDQTANAVEIGVMGSSLSVELTSNNLSYMQVFVDGENKGRIEISSGKGVYNVVDGLDGGYHVVRIVKDTEMQHSQWTLHSFAGDKVASVAEKSQLKIEFIGDSLSAGYGNLGSRGEGWSIKNSSAIGSYPYKTAALLGADYSIIAWSGICTKVYLWSDINMSTLYGWKSFYNKEAYDFADEPDVIVVNLGTNEANYIYDGHKEYTSESMFEDYLEFLNSIRRKNPNAYIICLYGVAGEHPQITEGIQMASALIDDKVVFNPFEFTPNASGAVGHPTAEANTVWAEQLAEYIESLNIR